MLILYTFVLGLLPLFADVLAHKEPQTAEEVEVERSLRAAAYHVRSLLSVNVGSFSRLPSQCAPAVAEFTAARKRSWAQKVLAGRPELPGYQDLFSSGVYEDLPASNSDQTIMECAPVSETHIQNNTCVLAPESTEGPYYHTEGHPIRQNIAELQDGLLLVSRILYRRIIDI